MWIHEVDFHLVVGSAAFGAAVGMLIGAIFGRWLK